MLSGNFFNRVKSFIDNKSLSSFSDEVNSDKIRHPNYYVSRGKFAIHFGFGAFIIWASFAPLDRGVSAPGWIITDGEKKTVQHTSGGFVEDIFVEEGKHVNQGDLLIKLSDVSATSNSLATNSVMLGLQGKADGLKNSIKQLKIQVGNLSAQYGNYVKLSSEGFMAKNRVLEVSNQLAQARSTLSDLEGQLVLTEKQITENQAHDTSYKFDIEKTEIKAPVSGEVVNLTVFTKGGVVTPGQKVLEISPENQPLVAVGQLPVHLVDRVEEGEYAELIFSALNQNTTPHIPAKIFVVGNDRIIDEKTGQPYYKIEAKVTKEGMDMLSGNKIRAGMPVEIFIKTGERTLMSYLLKPITDRAHGALRE